MAVVNQPLPRLLHAESSYTFFSKAKSRGRSPTPKELTCLLPRFEKEGVQAGGGRKSTEPAPADNVNGQALPAALDNEEMRNIRVSGSAITTSEKRLTVNP